MFLVLSFFWFIRQTKTLLFWVYLWQLKEYHIGRFLDHFRTWKGKRIFLNKLLFLKIILLISLIVWYFLPLDWKVSIDIFLLYFLPLPKELLGMPLLGVFDWGFFILLVLYFLEGVKSIYDLCRKRLKTPILTKKTLVILFFGIIFETLVIFYFYFSLWLISIIWLLSIDILSPVIFSLLVLSFQPFTVLIRNQIIKKAKQKREKFKNLIVIGITGSYGKTSTKEFLATILSEKYNVLKTEKNQNSEIGISQCILRNLRKEHEVFVCEMAAYNKGGIKLLCDIAKPQIGIITGVNEQHLATFGSMENLLSAEGGKELIESLPKTGFVVFNGDNKYCRQLYKEAWVSKRICYTTFGASADEVVQGDFWAKEIKAEKDLLYFKIFSRWGEITEFKLNLLGEHYAQNILLAAVVAKEILGMTLEEIAKACKKIRPEQGGMRLIKTKDGLNVIDTTYSANPDGVIAHLEYLKTWPGKKIIVMPCLIELGPASKEVHRRIGRKIGEVCDLAIITTRDYFQEIGEEAIKKGMKRENVVFTENPKEIFEIIRGFCQKEDVVLLEGRVPKLLIKKLIY